MKASISVENYLSARQWFDEALICHKRSIIIHVVSPNDLHGAIEALQHSHELCYKALKKAYGLPWLRGMKGHNPSNEIKEIMARFFEIFPDKQDDPLWRQIIEWSKTQGNRMARLHNTTIYGDDDGHYPSELFTEEQYGEYLGNVSLELEFWYRQLLYIGKELNALSPEDEKQLVSTVQLGRALREDSELNIKIRKLVEERFK